VQKDLLEPTFRGVYGWLFLLCFLLVIIRPLFGLVQITDLYRLYNEPPRPIEGLHAAIPVAILGIGTLMIAGIYVGLRLWRIKPGALGLAYAYFLLELAVTIIVVASDYVLVDYPSSTQRSLLSGGISQITITLIWCGVWIAYLSNSKRVSATYRPYIEDFEAWLEDSDTSMGRQN